VYFEKSLIAFLKMILLWIFSYLVLKASEPTVLTAPKPASKKSFPRDVNSEKNPDFPLLLLTSLNSLKKSFNSTSSEVISLSL